MIPYFVLLATVAVGSLLERPRRYFPDRRATAPAFLLFVFAIWLLVGFRYEVGGDWFSYLAYFREVEPLDFRQALDFGDPAYSLINWVASRFNLGLWWVNAICAAIFCVGLANLCLSQPRPWLGLLVAIPYFVIVVAMGYTRQSAAIGLALLAIDGLVRRRSYLRFSIWILLAATFHKTALFVILISQIASLRKSWVGIFLILFSSVVGYWLFLRESISGLIDVYISSNYSSSGAFARAFLSFIPSLIFVLLQGRISLTTEERKVWTGFAWFGLAMIPIMIVSPSSTAVDRLGLYLIPIQIVILSRIPGIFRYDGFAQSRLVVFGLILYCAAVFGAWFSIGDYTDAWVPYGSYIRLGWF